MILFYFGFNGFHNFPHGLSEDVGGFMKIELPVKEVSKVSLSWSSVSYVDDENNLKFIGFNDEYSKKNTTLNFKVTEAAISDKHLVVITETGFGKIFAFHNECLFEIKQLELQKHKLVACSVGDSDALFINEVGKVVWISLKNKCEEFLLPLAWKITEICCGKEHMLLLNENGTVYSFGQGSRGQLGHGTIESESDPRVVECLEGIPVKHIAAGGWHSAAVTQSGDLFTWGWNESGQLGLPTTSKFELAGNKKNNGDCVENELISVQAVPINIPLDDGVIDKVSCGARHTMAVANGGQIWAFGWNRYGQLGLRGNMFSQPTQVVCFSTGTVYHVCCGGWSTIVHSSQTDT